MSTDIVISLMAIACVLVFYADSEATKNKINHLEREVELLHKYNESQEKLINTLLKHVDQNVCDIRQLSESCNQIKDLDTKVSVSQKDIERTLDMIEELKAQRSMDILDKLREENK